jgi:hypothetical protein
MDLRGIRCANSTHSRILRLVSPAPAAKMTASIPCMWWSKGAPLSISPTKHCTPIASNFFRCDSCRIIATGSNWPLELRSSRITRVLFAWLSFGTERSTGTWQWSRVPCPSLHRMHVCVRMYPPCLSIGANNENTLRRACWVRPARTIRDSVHTLASACAHHESCGRKQKTAQKNMQPRCSLKCSSRAHNLHVSSYHARLMPAPFTRYPSLSSLGTRAIPAHLRLITAVLLSCFQFVVEFVPQKEA